MGGGDAEAVAEGEADGAAGERQGDRLDEKLDEHVLRRAPSALRRPISRVRSVTETSMMFMIPMPPTRRATPTMPMTTAVMLSRMLPVVFSSSSCTWTLKSSASPAATWWRWRSTCSMPSRTGSTAAASRAWSWSWTASPASRPKSVSAALKGTNAMSSRSRPSDCPFFSITPITVAG